MGIYEAMAGFRKKMVSCLAILLPILILSGCAPAEKVYNAFSEMELTDEELELLSEGKLSFVYEKGDFSTVKDYWKYKAYIYIQGGNRFLKSNAVNYMMISIAVGMVIMLLAKKAIKIRRMALIVFILGIPAIIFVLIYGTAIIADMLS